MMPEDRQKLYKLIEMHTRCTIMARHGHINWPEYGQYFADATELEDQIRDLMFGTHDLIELGQKWGLLKPYPKEREEHVKEKKEAPAPVKEKHHDQGTTGGHHKSHRLPLL